MQRRLKDFLVAAIRCAGLAALSWAALAAFGAGAPWAPVEGQLLTRWAGQVSAENPWPEYPRPQLRREQWLNLNGLWDYAVTARNAPRPGGFAGEILVPFPIESALSGVKRAVLPQEALWYRRSFEIPRGWSGRRLRLHFGAVDWHATVWVNGVEAGVHRGGYTPFSFDITRALSPGGPQEIVVRVWDPTNQGTQPRGKQVLEPQGIWYTAVTGIWQTVWLEPVGQVAIERLRLEPDIDQQKLRLKAVLDAAPDGLTLEAAVRDSGSQVALERGPAAETLEISLPEPKLWSPDSPHRYDLELRLLRGGDPVDDVESYFAMRKIALGRGDAGHTRLFLNNKPLFHFGPLDQGWWPDGLYTAPSDEALIYDIKVTRDLGFNMARKHVKVEPARWYYHCDRLGLLVWQDMPSAFFGGRDPGSLFVDAWSPEDADRDEVSAAQFEAELREMLDHFGHFPSIVVWVPFNEGWGQYDTARITKWVRQYDPTRLVNAASGWTDRGVGDVYDTHMYPGPGMQHGGPQRAAVLGEFGGLGWPVENHLWWNKRNWGYRTYHSRDELAEKYREVVRNVIGPYSRGLAAAIYTQTTDVEGEVNGLMTYDRKRVKFDAADLKRLHEPFYTQPPKSRILLRSSNEERQPWRYTRERPAPEWIEPQFSDAGWESGEAPFRSSPDWAFPTGTLWKPGPIWLRREFSAGKMPENLWLEALHSVVKGAVYLNGVKIDELEGRTRHEYRHRDISRFVSALRPGKNILAIEADPGEESRRDLDAGLYVIE